jgi:hypothetical protein
MALAPVLAPALPSASPEIVEKTAASPDPGFVPSI